MFHGDRLFKRVYKVEPLLSPDLRYINFEIEIVVTFINFFSCAPNSAKIRGGCRGPAKIRQRGCCNNFVLFTR